MKGTKILIKPEAEPLITENKPDNVSRKYFLKLAGISAIGISMAGCGVNSITPAPAPGLNLGPDPRPDDNAIYIGKDDTGLFNFIYAIEQLQAAFYGTVVQQFYAGASSLEQQVITDIYNHEIAHTAFYKAFLADNGIPQLEFDFYTTDFTDRQSVLKSLRLIQDVVASMYNYIGALFSNTDYLDIIIKIASVEGRQAAAVRNLLKPQSTFFIDDTIIDSTGFDAFNNPADIQNILFPFIVPTLDIADIPKYIDE